MLAATSVREHVLHQFERLACLVRVDPLDGTPRVDDDIIIDGHVVLDQRDGHALPQPAVIDDGVLVTFECNQSYGDSDAHDA